MFAIEIIVGLAGWLNGYGDHIVEETLQKKNRIGLCLQQEGLKNVWKSDFGWNDV